MLASTNSRRESGVSPRETNKQGKFCRLYVYYVVISSDMFRHAQCLAGNQAEAEVKGKLHPEKLASDLQRRLRFV